MKKFFKVVFIVGICGVGTVALAHAVLGKERARNAAHALRHMAQSEVDELIAKQKDLKHELNALRNEYPRQIAVIRSQHKQVDRQLEALDVEETRAADIVRLCEEDISYLEDQRDVVGSVYTDDRVIEHRGSRYNAAEADVLITRINETRGIYVNRLDEIRHERSVLHSEKDQLSLELHAIEAEQQEFEAEYQSLLREIERLERNQELLRVAEQRRGLGFDRHGEAMSTLNEVKTAVERARFEQEERLKSARKGSASLDYETRARLLEIQRKREAKQKTEDTPESTLTETEEPDEEEDFDAEFSVR